MIYKDPYIPQMYTFSLFKYTSIKLERRVKCADAGNSMAATRKWEQSQGDASRQSKGNHLPRSAAEFSVSGVSRGE